MAIAPTGIRYVGRPRQNRSVWFRRLMNVFLPDIFRVHTQFFAAIEFKYRRAPVDRN
jgi:hypothetical protein